MEMLVHVYECEECIVTFSVDQECEEQSDVKCPLCLTDQHVKDVGGGMMVVRFNTQCQLSTKK